MSFSDPRQAKGFSATPEDADDAHPLEGLAERLAGRNARGRGPAESPRRDLEQLVSMLASRNIQTEDRLTSALEGLARWVERSDAEQGAPELRRPAPQQPEVQGRDEIEERLSALARTLTDPKVAEAPEPKPQQPPAEAPVASLRAALAQIAARQKDLDDREPAPVEPVRPHAPQPPAPGAAFPTPPAPVRVSAQRTYAPAQRPAAPLAQRPSAPEKPAPAQPAIDAGVVKELRREIDQLGRAVEDLPTRADVDGLLKEIGALAARWSEERPARLDADSLRAIESLVTEVEHMRGDAASPQMLERFADELGALSARLEQIGPSSAGALQDLARRIDAVRAELAQFPRVSAVDELANDIQSLVARIEEQERAAAKRDAETRDFEAALRAELESFSPAVAIDDFGHKLDYLTNQVEAQRASATEIHGLPGKIDAVAGKLDALAAATLTRTADVERVADVVRAELATMARPDAIDDIGRKIEALTLELASRPAPVSGVEQLSDKVDGLGDRLEDVAAATRARGAAFERIEDAVRGIAEHLVVTSSGASLAPEALNGLEGRIAGLVDTLERSDGRLDDLNAGFAAMAARIEQSCSGLGEEAGRSAAAAVRESFIEQGSAEGVGVGAGDLAEALGELRAMAARNDRRTADTLDAVRMTLERLVDRMDALSDAGERPAPASYRALAEELPPAPPAPAVDATSAARAAARRALAEIAAEQPEPARASYADSTAFTPIADLAPDHPLEPGSAAHARPMAPEVAAPSVTASMIAAARRAQTQPVAEPEALSETAGSSGSRFGSVLAAIKARRRPLLLALAAALIVIGVVQFARSLQSEPVEMAPEPAPQSRMSPAPAPEAPVARAPAAAPAPSVAVVEPPAAPPPSDELAAAAPPPSAPKPGAMLTPPRAPAADMTDFAFAQSLGAGVQKFTARGEDFNTGSISRGPDGLPDSIGGPMLRMRAVQGDPSAQLEIADRLADGRGAPADPAAAARWLEKAAAQGLAPAQHRLGSLYEKGRGVTRDLAVARRWYEQAAASGNVRAMHNLGVIHAEGGLGKPDFNAAIVWFRMAAERGLVDSQYNLAVLEARGLGGKRDLADAYKWFALANVQGDQDAAIKRDEVGKALGAGLAAAKQAVASFRPRMIDSSANEAPTPAGGWDQASARPDAKTPAALR